MPRRMHKFKSKTPLLKRILHFFIPCCQQTGVLDDASSVPLMVGPQCEVLRPRVDEQNRMQTQAASHAQKELEYDGVTNSMALAVSSNSCNNPCESFCDPLSSRQEPSDRLPLFDTGLLHPSYLRDTDSESRTLGSEASVKSAKNGKSLDLDTPSPEGPSFFSNARDFRADHWQVIVNEAPRSPSATGKWWSDTRALEGWETLLGWAETSALYDSWDRLGSPKCDEGTRVEVIAEITSWLADPNSSQGLLCMTGSPGAGKSSLQQSIAAQCTKKNIPAATFLFSQNDPWRNNTSFIIPTIAYQLGLADPALRNLLGTSVSDDPLVINKCLQSQLMTLIVEPINTLRSSDPVDDEKHPYIILIDSLNECKDEDRQAELLEAIKECILEAGHHHFRIIISSRIGRAINTTLAPQDKWPAQVYHIHLTMNSAVTDIRRMSWRRLQRSEKDRKPSRRATLLPLATRNGEPLPDWRQGTGSISRPSRQQRPAGLDLRRESSAQASRSRSVPPTTPFTPVYIFHPSPTPVITPQDFVNAAPILTSHTHSFQPLYIHSHFTPEPVGQPSYLGQLNQEPEPDSGATDMTTSELYPPSPCNTESPVEPESPMTPCGTTLADAYRAQTPTMRKYAPQSNDSGMDPSGSTPRLAQPQPIRPLAIKDGRSPHFAPDVASPPSWLRNSPQSLFGSQSRSPSPIFLGDPRRTFVPERGGSTDGTAFERKAKRRRQTLQQDHFDPPLPASTRPERVALPDEAMRTRKRQKTVPGKCHEPREILPEFLDVD